MTTRRGFLKGATLSAVPFLCPQLALGTGEAGRRPNIIFILADDLGYGDLGCYGQEKIKTPNIDRMAREGIRFTQFYAGSTVCAPSRCSLMTGLHTGHTFIRGNKEVQPEGQAPIPAETFTVAKMLHKAGYTTGAVGKWGLGPPGSTGEPNRQGFDHWFGYLCQRQAHFYYPPYLWRNGQKVVLDENRDGTKSTYSHDLMTDEALAFVENHQDDPFFLYLAYTIPHAELAVPEDSIEPYRGKFPEIPFPGKHYGAQKTPRAALAAMISRMDRDVGRLMALLKKLDIDENTLVMFSSDNGPHKEGGIDPAFFDSNGPLRGIKRDLYEGGIRVPMIARWPGKIRPGTETDHVAAFWDLLPTCADLAGTSPPRDIDGISFLPSLLDREQRRHEYMYWEFKGKQAVRTGDWKAVRLAPDGPIELYNLETDLGEQNDVSGLNPAIVSRIERIMNVARTESPEFPLRTH